MFLPPLSPICIVPSRWSAVSFSKLKTDAEDLLTILSSIIFGPNSFPAHNSVIYTSEVQCEFTRKALIEPLLFGRGTMVAVKQSAEDRNNQAVQNNLKGMVWEAGCSNWYLNQWGTLPVLLRVRRNNPL